MAKLLPLGISDFKTVVSRGYAYIDKTLLIQELVEKGSHVALIPRPRRFGKTLNLSMLRYFFEKGTEDTSSLFRDLHIWQYANYRAMQGTFPVIFLSFKDVKHTSWQETFDSLRLLVAQEFERHNYLLQENFLGIGEKEDYLKILFKEGNVALTEQSLFLLTKWLFRYHGKAVVLLIDEYDTPVHSAFVYKYYDTLIVFLRNWLSAVLKDNVYLERSVLTGILRIAKESIFSGLNNIITYTTLNDTFSDKFGLLESEVHVLLKEQGLLGILESMRRWYDGYQVGSCAGLYNPWSVLQCIASGGALAPYWINTSENTLIKQLLAQGSDYLKADIEVLLNGGVIEKTIEDGIVFSTLQENSDTVWSLLLYTGYLTLDSAASYGTACRLRIPNIEVTELYKSIILDWFKKSLQEDNYRLLLNSLVSGDVETFSQLFQEFMLSSASVFDLPAEDSEKIYHAFVLGMLIGLCDRYEVRSNRESGLGRYDVMLIPKNPRDLGIIMEFKKVGRFEKIDLETAVNSALRQIEEKHYAQELRDRGVSRILYVGLAFEGKRILIRSKEKAASN